MKYCTVTLACVSLVCFLSEWKSSLPTLCLYVLHDASTGCCSINGKETFMFLNLWFYTLETFFPRAFSSTWPGHSRECTCQGIRAGMFSGSCKHHFIDSSIKVTTSISLISKRFTAAFLAQGKEKNDVLEILKRSSSGCQFPHAWRKGPPCTAGASCSVNRRFFLRCTRFPNSHSRLTAPSQVL